MRKPEFDNAFVQDALAILRQKAQGQIVHRRRFLAALGVLGAMPLALRLTPAHAQSSELVIVSWGGDAVPAFETIWAVPFTASGRMPAVVDGSGPSSGKIKAMVESNAVSWDICDRNLPASIELGQVGLLEEVDWTVVDPEKLREAHRTQWGGGSAAISIPLR